MRARIGELLVQAGAIGARRLEEAYRRQVVYGGALDTVLLEMNAVEEPRLRAALAQASGLPSAPEERLAALETEKLIAPLAELSARLRVAPLFVEDDSITAIVCETSDSQAAQLLSNAAGMPVRTWITPEYRVYFELERLYGVAMPPRMAALARRRLGAIVRELFSKKHVRDPRADEKPSDAPREIPAELSGWDTEGDEPPAPKPFVRDDAPAPEPPPPPIVRQDSAPALDTLPAWTRLVHAEHRDQIFEALCELGCARMEYAAVFTVHGPTAVLRMAASLDGPATGAELSVPLEAATAFHAAVQTSSPYLGKVDDTSRKALGRLGREPELAMWLPITVAGRVVALLYGDHGPRPPRAQDVADLSVAAVEAGKAFHALILRAKKGTFTPAPEAPVAKITAAEAAPAAPDIAPEYAPFYEPDPEPAAKVPEGREVEGDLASIEKPRVLEMEAIPEVEAADVVEEDKAAVPPPLPEAEPTVIVSNDPPEQGNDLPPVAGSTEIRPGIVPKVPSGPSVIVAADEPDALAQMVATGSTEEAHRAAEALLGLGPNGLDALLRRFPGPLSVDRRAARGGELAPVLQHGPVLRAIARFGRRAVAPLLRMLGHANADVRFYATFLFTELCFPEALPLLGLRLYDTDGQIRQVALEVIRRFEGGLGADVGGREYREVIERLRADLLEPDVDRARLAAVAIGELRDSASVPRLVELLRHRDARVVDSAHRALVVITKQDFALSRWRWRAWWDKNRGRHRIEWMLEGLAHKAPEVRLSASEELKRLTHEYFGYHFDLPKREREEARRKWMTWWEQVGRKRFAKAATEPARPSARG